MRSVRALLGLPTSTNHRLALEKVHVLHNAWSVDFNRHLTSFEPRIHGVRQLVECACKCTYDAVIFFVSSMSAVANWGLVAGARAKVPEMILEDWHLAKIGYGQSKLISERILAEASKRCGIRTALCRVGQVAGPVLRGEQGRWREQECLPNLIASSKFLEKIPETLGPLGGIDWVPVDLMAQIIVKVVAGHLPESDKTRKRKTAAVYQVVNPHSAPWASVLTTVIEGLGVDVSVIKFTEWVTAPKRSATRGSLPRESRD